MTLTSGAARSSLERRSSVEFALFCAPAALFIAAVFGTPLAIIVQQSLRNEAGHLSLFEYGRIFSHPMYGRIAWATLQISVLATGLAVLLAYPLAYYLASQSPRRRSFLTILVLVPFWTSSLVKGFAFVVLLGHSGVVNSVLGHLGIGPLPLLFNRAGVVIGMSHYLVAFVMFPILTNLIAQPAELRRAAAILGAGRWRIFWRVTAPLSLPGVVTGALLGFILSLGFYILPALLGGLHDMMLSNMVNFYTTETIDWPMASALAVLLTGVAAVAALCLSRIPGGGSIFAAEGRT